MEVRHLPNQDAYQRMTTEELRRSYVADQLFADDAISTIYIDADRAIIGGAIPTAQPLQLLATKKELAAEYFAERREIGIVNIGGDGVVRTDDTHHTLKLKDMLYIGRGVKEIEFSSVNAKEPAAFFFISFPAHAAFPTTMLPAASAEKVTLGTPEQANRRTIAKYIHPGGAKSCQLVMGLTDLEQGSVWNTMPPHTHLRRMEVYLYFGLDPDSLVVHLMGQPDHSRSVILRNRQAVISPVWSIHCGAGTRNYSFIWAMGGENQEFTDMDPVGMQELL
ncbi:5-dehydro-4-deoxy-D-glucuronate isomerase [Sphingobacteriales bacterium CHB3]|nr:5-dehydro-4-deoxy-D-glucuronate isomerase [Sphingobacteriales bacterium CHB3]